MERACFTFEIFPDKLDEYKKRHDEIWPEMVKLIEQSGLRNYTLFRRGTQVIAYVECHRDVETAFAFDWGVRCQRPLVRLVHGAHCQPDRQRRESDVGRRGLAPQSTHIGGEAHADRSPSRVRPRVALTTFPVTIPGVLSLARYQIGGEAVRASPMRRRGPDVGSLTSRTPARPSPCRFGSDV